MNSTNIEEYKELIKMLASYTALYGTSFLFVLTSNLMLIYGFYKTSRPFTIITKLFICLAICQLTVTLILVPNIICIVWIGVSRLHYILFIAFIYLAVLMDLFTLLTISFLRFLTIFKPLYRVKTRTVYKILYLEFLVSVLAASSMFLGNIILVSEVIQVKMISYKISTGSNFVIVFITSTLNTSSLIILRRSTNSKAQQKGDNVLGNQMVIKRKKMALITLLLITLVQFVCTLPSACLSFMDVYGLLSNNYFSLMFFIFQCLQLLNIGIVSLIIVWRTKNLRQFYRSKCCCF